MTYIHHNGGGNHALDDLRDSARAVDTGDGDVLHPGRIYPCAVGHSVDCRSHQDLFRPVACLTGEV